MAKEEEMDDGWSTPDWSGDTDGETDPYSDAEHPALEIISTNSRKRKHSDKSMVDDLKALTDHVYIMLLPDRSVALADPEHRRRWAAHLALHRYLAASRDWVTIIDLVPDGVKTARDFTDGFHLHKRGKKQQLALFDRRLEALGLRPEAGDAK